MQKLQGQQHYLLRFAVGVLHIDRKRRRYETKDE
jgi:hypothetical protein